MADGAGLLETINFDGWNQLENRWQLDRFQPPNVALCVFNKVHIRNIRFRWKIAAGSPVMGSQLPLCWLCWLSVNKPRGSMMTSNWAMNARCVNTSVAIRHLNRIFLYKRHRWHPQNALNSNSMSPIMISWFHDFPSHLHTVNPNSIKLDRKPIFFPSVQKMYIYIYIYIYQKRKKEKRNPIDGDGTSPPLHGSHQRSHSLLPLNPICWIQLFETDRHTDTRPYVITPPISVFYHPSEKYYIPTNTWTHRRQHPTASHRIARAGNSHRPPFFFWNPENELCWRNCELSFDTKMVDLERFLRADLTQFNMWFLR